MSPAPSAPVSVDPNEGLTWATLPERLRLKFSLPENAHLLRKRSPEEMTSRTVTSVLRAFSGFPKSVTLAGGATLLRATSFRDPSDGDHAPSPGRRNNPFGSWWFPESVFLEILDQCGGDSFRNSSDCSDCVREKLQAVLALSDNFSDIEQLWCLRLNAGEKLTVLAGSAFPQPRDSGLAGSYLNMGNLPGGATQYYLLNVPEGLVKQYSHQLLEGFWFGKRILR
jgi:hypothetical protein